MTKPIRKAVIAAAGFGTRFLPQTKAMPKEMLPLIDKPVIQYIVEELVAAGVQDIIIVTGYHKRTIEDHFDQPNADLINNLHDGGKDEFIKIVENVSNIANFAYIRQKGPYGTGTPLLCAEHLIGDEPFFYSYADDLLLADVGRFEQLRRVYEVHGGSVLTCLRANKPDDYKRYGYVGGADLDDGVVDIQTIVEKPGSAQAAPSDLASTSGYLLDPAIFPYLREQAKDLPAGEELLIQTSMQNMVNDGHKYFACEIKDGKYYDTGNKLGYLKTVVDFALARDDVGADFKDYLKSLAL
jgi:UTP--glucose-1-phosphate uridylyltransferase